MTSYSKPSTINKTADFYTQEAIAASKKYDGLVGDFVYCEVERAIGLAMEQARAEGFERGLADATKVYRYCPRFKLPNCSYCEDKIRALLRDKK